MSAIEVVRARLRRYRWLRAFVRGAFMLRRAIYAQLRRYRWLRALVRGVFALRPAIYAQLRQRRFFRAIVHAGFQSKHWVSTTRHRWTPVAVNTISGSARLGRLLLATSRVSVLAGSRRVVMLVVSDLRYDPRVEREARALAAAGFDLTVIFPDISIPPIAEEALDWGPGVSFRPLPLEASSYVMGFPWLFGHSMYRAACAERPLAFHCHDLNTAPIGLAAARRAKALCVCDFHEWFSENVSWDAKAERWTPHRPARRQFYRMMERLAMNRASAVVTVCDSIAQELQSIGRPSSRPVAVVRNIPELSAVSSRPYAPLKQELGIPEDRFLLLWQGGTGPTRLIEPIIEALTYAPEAVFVIRGPSLDLFGDAYRALAERCGVADRLLLLPPVPSRDVVTAARGADAGIWTLPNLSKNFYYALPNKVFEYLASGLPVLAAHFPEARKLIEGNGVGLCFDPYDPQSIAAALNRLINEPHLATGMRAVIPGVLASIDANREWQKLVALYQDLAGDVREVQAA